MHHPSEPFSYRAQSTPITTLRELKKGKIPFERVINLRGLTLDEAQAQLDQSIMSTYPSCCLLIIHGQGNRSKDQIPMIKTYVIESLPRHPRVIAMASALPKDGGLGAMYVLLKKADLR